MSNSVQHAMTSGIVKAEKLQGYIDAVEAIVDVCGQAESEGKIWPRARCNAILADCRKRFWSRLDRLDQSKFSEWEYGFSYLLDDLWNTINPVSTVNVTELICRIKKAGQVSGTLVNLLSALIVVEEMYPHKDENEEEIFSDLDQTIGADGKPEDRRRYDKRNQVMVVNVHMTAFGEEGEIRAVRIPLDALGGDDPGDRDILNLVYRYGQNEEQPQDHPSVSTGDVVELHDGRLFLCALSSWRRLSREQFEDYQREAYAERQSGQPFITILHPLVLGEKVCKSEPREEAVCYCCHKLKSCSKVYDPYGEDYISICSMCR